MKLGILGTGMIVKDLMTTYSKFDIKKTYLLATTQTQQEAEELCQKYHLDQIFYDYDQLLDSDIDTVYIALPNHLHYSFAKKAILKGKHVIIEKPICANAHELQDLIDLSHEHHIIILEAMNIHYLPAYQSLKTHLSKLGQIKILNFNYSQYSSRYDAFKEGRILPAFDYHKAGGALMDLNVYNLHAIIGLMGQPVNQHYFANIEKGIDTSGIITLDYGTFKAVLIGAKDCKAPIMTSIQGDQGCLVLDTPANNASRFKLLKNDKSEYDYDEQHGQHRMYYEFVEFVKIFEQKDYDRAQEMMQKSLIAMKIATLARKSAGVEFPADKR